MQKLTFIFVTLLMTALVLSVPNANCVTYLYEESVTVAEMINGAKNVTDLNTGYYTLEIFDHVTYTDSGLYSVYLLDASDSGTVIHIYRDSDADITVRYHDVLAGVVNQTAIEIANTTYSKLVVSGETFVYGTYYKLTIEKTGYTNATSLGFAVTNLNETDSGYATIRLSGSANVSGVYLTDEMIGLLVSVAVIVAVVGVISYKRF